MSEFLRGLRERPLLTASVLGLAGTLALSGCGTAQPEVREGTIIAKRDIPEHTTTTIVPIPHTSCSGYKPRVCHTSYTYIPVTTHHDEAFQLTVENCAIKPQEAAECPQRIVAVPRAIFDQMQIGDQFTIPQSS